MAWSAVTDINDGQDFGGAAWQSAIDAVGQLQSAVGPDVPALLTWASPIAAGITQGNGTVTAQYSRMGKIVVATFHFVLGSTSAITGDVSLNLPVQSVGPVVGSGFLTVNTRYVAHVTALTAPATTVIVRAEMPFSGGEDAQVPLAATVPATWAEGHQVQATLVYLDGS